MKNNRKRDAMTPMESPTNTGETGESGDTINTKTAASRSICPETISLFISALGNTKCCTKTASKKPPNMSA